MFLCFLSALLLEPPLIRGWARPPALTSRFSYFPSLSFCSTFWKIFLNVIFNLLYWLFNLCYHALNFSDFLHINWFFFQFSSVTQSCLTLCNPMNCSTPGLPCPSPTPGVHSDSRPSSPWCHPAISSSVIPFSSCPQSLPASESLPMSQLFAWGGESTGASALASFLPKKSQGWSPSE